MSDYLSIYYPTVAGLLLLSALPLFTAPSGRLRRASAAASLLAILFVCSCSALPDNRQMVIPAAVAGAMGIAGLIFAIMRAVSEGWPMRGVWIAVVLIVPATAVAGVNWYKWSGPDLRANIESEFRRVYGKDWSLALTETDTRPHSGTLGGFYRVEKGRITSRRLPFLAVDAYWIVRREDDAAYIAKQTRNGWMPYLESQSTLRSRIGSTQFVALTGIVRMIEHRYGSDASFEFLEGPMTPGPVGADGERHFLAVVRILTTREDESLLISWPHRAGNGPYFRATVLPIDVVSVNPPPNSLEDARGGGPPAPVAPGQ